MHVLGGIALDSQLGLRKGLVEMGKSVLLLAELLNKDPAPGTQTSRAWRLHGGEGRKQSCPYSCPTAWERTGPSGLSLGPSSFSEDRTPRSVIEPLSAATSGEAVLPLGA